VFLKILVVFLNILWPVLLKLSFLLYQMGVDREIITEILENEKDNQIEKIKCSLRSAIRRLLFFSL